MRLERIKSLAAKGVALDTETHLVQAGLLAPPLVCGSVGWLTAGPRIEAMILDKQQTLETFAQALEDPEVVLVGANIAFDLLVLATELAKRGIDAMPAIFNCLAEQRVFDLQIAEALHAVACGHLGIDPRNGGPLKNPETGKRGRYSLAICTDLVLGRTDAKANDDWRLRYAELDNIPMSEWPQSAIEYPQDDARNTIETALAQSGHIPKVSPHHEWGVVDEVSTCLSCGSTRSGGPCMVRRPHRNLHDLSAQVATAFAMHAGAAWGFSVNQTSVDTIERHALRNQARGIKPFVDAQLVREDGTEDRSALKKRVAIAYGAAGSCATCRGTGEVPSPAAKPVRCVACKGRCVPYKAGGGIKPASCTCEVCGNTGLVANPNPPMIICFALDAEGNKIKTCDGTGLLLIDDVPRSDGGGIGYGRDVLHESGNEELMSYADYQEDAKDLNVYIPYLRTARVSDPITGLWRDVPLTLRPNVILESGRTSYDGVIQLFKRKPGYVDHDTQEYVPSLRECIEARPGYYLVSVDYDSGEIVTHAQSTLWITGYSELARALNSELKIHNALAATMMGLSYEEFQRRMELKDKVCKATRQAAKPAGFGFPGGLGPVKLVLQQRKSGPNTPNPNGPNMIKDEDGNLVRGNVGLRFCLLMGGATT